MDTTTTNNATRPQPQSKQYDLEVTILSAKHLKNVNWKTGNLKPYTILWIHPDRRQATKPDNHSSTKPIWNERFIFPLNPTDSTLTIEIYHSKPSETPKPLVGSTRFEIRNLFSNPSDDNNNEVVSLQLTRPSGRPQGKIRVRLSLVERIVENNYQSAPPLNYYYPPSSPSYGYMNYARLPPPPPPYSYGYYPGYHSTAVPPPRYGGYGGVGPSAPVDYTPNNDYGSRVSGAFGGLRLDEGVGESRGEEKVFERVGSDVVSSSSRDVRYGDYRDIGLKQRKMQGGIACFLTVDRRITHIVLQFVYCFVPFGLVKLMSLVISACGFLVNYFVNTGALKMKTLITGVELLKSFPNNIL